MAVIDRVRRRTFHDRNATRTSSGELVLDVLETAGANVDICVPYYNAGQYLPYLLRSLAEQTVHTFTVYVVNDGSTEQSAIETFSQLEREYADRRWKFITTEHQGASSARNLAASLGTGQYISFMDAEDAALPHMVERLAESMEVSADDVLTCYAYVFDGDGPPFVGGVPRLPIGNCPEATIFGNPFGGFPGIMRREVFERSGGFTPTSDAYIGSEDVELLTRLALQGYAIDVIPEFLFFSRHGANSRSQIVDDDPTTRRVLHVLEATLRPTGLAGIASLATGLQKKQEAAGQIDRTMIGSGMLRRLDELETEKAFWVREAENLRQHASQGDEAFIEHQKWIAELEAARDWHDEQRRQWQQIAEERDALLSELVQRVERAVKKKKRKRKEGKART
jgi:GT2 family glycosyltransferase